MDDFLTGKDIAGQAMLWGGSLTAGIGGLFSAISAEGVSGGLVTAGGIAVVAYGLVSAGRDRATKRAFEREQQAYDRLDAEIMEHQKCKAENAALVVQVAAMEAKLKIQDALIAAQQQKGAT